MIRFLPFILIPVLLVAGLWYWRSSTINQNLVSSRQEDESFTPIEVPKTLPGATTENRVESLEDTVTKLASQVNNLKSSSSQAPSNLDSKLNNIEAAVIELKARVSALEQATPAPAAAATSGQSTVYIPLGAGGSWADLDWNSLSEYEISLNPDNYPGYKGMYLEANFRLIEPVGTGSVRLYNVTDGSAVSSELSTTSTTFALKTSSSFKLPAGTKTYRLQVKSSERRDVFIQSARIRVNF